MNEQQLRDENYWLKNFERNADILITHQKHDLKALSALISSQKHDIKILNHELHECKADLRREEEKCKYFHRQLMQQRGLNDD